MPLSSARGLAMSPAAQHASGTGGLAGILRTIEGTVGTLSHTIGGVFTGIGGAGLVGSLTKALLDGFFRDLLAWVANGAASLVAVLGRVLSSTTEPVLSGSAFRSEFDVMAVLGAAVALPLLAVGAIQAIIRQQPGELLRSALVRLPLALLFTGVSVQLVALGLAATDQASAMVLGAAGDPAHRLLAGLVAGLGQAGGPGLAAFGAFLVVLTAAVVAFVLWLELAVRSAAIAAASLFLPLALVGLAWPATAHWARRLGETLAALVLSKLVIASVLALAAGLLGSSSSLAGVVEGVALLAVAAFAPFVLLKLVPAVEGGAVAHLEGLSRRPVRAGQRLGTSVTGLEIGGIAGLSGFSSIGSKGAGGPGVGGSNLRTLDHLGAGPFTADRPVAKGALPPDAGPSRPWSVPACSSSGTRFHLRRTRPPRRVLVGCRSRSSARGDERCDPRGQRLPAGPCCYRRATGSMVEESARYQLGPRSRRGLVAGWRGGQLTAVGAGLVAGVLLFRSLGGAGGALLAFVSVASAVAFSTLPIAGRSAEQWTPVVAFHLTRRVGMSRRGHSALSTLQLDEIPVGVAGRSIGVVVDRAAGTLTAAVRVGGSGFALGDEEDRALRIVAWSGVLAGSAREAEPFTDCSGWHVACRVISTTTYRQGLPTAKSPLAAIGRCSNKPLRCCGDKR